VTKRLKIIQIHTARFDQKQQFLTDEQQHVVDTLNAINHKIQKYTPAVLHGVTSSGKTEIL